MSWLADSIRRYVSGEQCETYDQCVSRLRDVQLGPNVTTADRVEQIEDDLARAVLLIHTLTEACIIKGVFTREEIARAASEIDLFDGTADGKLDPAVVRTARPDLPRQREGDVTAKPPALPSTRRATPST